MNSSRTDNIDMIADTDGSLSRSSSPESFYTNPSRIGGENRRNSADTQDERGSPSPDLAYRSIIEGTFKLMGRLRNNYNQNFGLDNYLSPPEEDFVEQDLPAEKCAEIASSVFTYVMTLCSLAIIASTVMRLSVVSDLEYPPTSTLKSSAPYLLPVGIFVYSLIFNWDRRPPRLVKLFLDLAEVRTILTKRIVPKIESKNESQLELENMPQLTTPLLGTVQRNMRQIRHYGELQQPEKSRVKRFAVLLRNSINQDGATGQWFYDSTRTGDARDKWKTMRVYGLFKKNRPPGCSLYLISEFDIKKCEEIKGDAVILTDNNTAYFVLNGQIAMEDDKPQVVGDINRYNLAMSETFEPINYRGSEWKKGRIIKEALQKGGHTQKIERHLRDLDEALLKKLKQESFRAQDDKVLNIISTGSEQIIKSDLEKLHEMISALTYANESGYLSLPVGFFTKLMNHNNIFRWSVFLLVAGSVVVSMMMSLDLCDMTVLFVNHMSRIHGNGTDAEIKANQNAATFILICPILPGLAALWAQLNTIPVFYGNIRKIAQYDTRFKRLLRWAQRSVCYDRFHNFDSLRIGNVVDLSMLGVTLGLLMAQPYSLNNGVLIVTAISYYAAKPFTMLANLFRNCLRRRVRIEEIKPGNREFPSRSLSQPLNSSMEMGEAFSQRSNSSNDLETKINGNASKFFKLQPDFENKYNGDNRKVIELGNPVAEYSTDFNSEYSAFH